MTGDESGLQTRLGDEPNRFVLPSFRVPRVQGRVSSSFPVSVGAGPGIWTEEGRRKLKEDKVGPGTEV